MLNFAPSAMVEQAPLLGGQKVRAADIIGLALAEAKSLLNKRHPDSGEPVLTRGNFERLFEPVVNPFVAAVKRPGHGIIQLLATANLRTTAGKNWTAQLVGGNIAGTPGLNGTTASATATTLTSGTVASVTANQYAGCWIVANISATASVYGLILSHTSGTAPVYTVDQWYTVGSSTGAASGSNPTVTNGQYTILPGATPAIWIAFTTTNITPAAGDTTLAGEITNADLKRSYATYAFTAGNATFTYSKTVTASNNYTVYGAGMFTGQNGSTLVFENTFSQGSATLNGAAGDALSSTWTITL